MICTIQLPKEGCMLVDDMLFEQEWFSELPLRLRFLYIYLLTKCTKTGIFEVNLRKMTYDLHDGYSFHQASNNSSASFAVNDVSGGSDFGFTSCRATPATTPPA